MTEPTKVSITVGVTDFPEPFRSVRVDATLHEVEATPEGIERAFREAGPVLENLFGRLTSFVLESKDELLERMNGGDLKDVRRAEASNQNGPSSLSTRDESGPPPRGRPNANDDSFR